MVTKVPQKELSLNCKYPEGFNSDGNKMVCNGNGFQMCVLGLLLSLFTTWQGLCVKVPVRLSRWHLKPAHFHLSKEQWRLHQVACHLKDLCHIRALLMVSLRTAWWGCSPCWRGSEVHVAAPMECTKCITKVQPHCNLDDIILHVKAHR